MTSAYEAGHTDTLASLQDINLFFLSNASLKNLLKGEDAKE
jgi:hypothetical protein